MLESDTLGHRTWTEAFGFAVLAVMVLEQAPDLEEEKRSILHCMEAHILNQANLQSEYPSPGDQETESLSGYNSRILRSFVPGFG